MSLVVHPFGAEDRRAKSAILLSGALLIASGGAQAFQIQSDNPDVSMRWDNTVRYNAAWRVKGRDPGIANNPAQDEGDYLFDKGDMTTNRVDLFSEFDFSYQNTLGFRVSGALWYDERYGDTGKSNPLLPGSNYPGNRFSNYVKRYYAGPSGEFLDAFVWANQSIGETELSLKLGRHAVLWGEAMFPTASGNSIAVDMAPADAQKQTLSPGATAKETALPITQLTGTWQLLPRLSISGQYTFDWRPSRVPEGGTYLGVADSILFGPPLVNAAGNGVGPAIPSNAPIEGKGGDWGMALKYRPSWLDEGTVGLFYREFDAKTPVWAANTFLAPGPNARAVYAKDISLWGISYGGTVLGNAVGAEVSYRRNTPLNMNPAAITSAALGYEGPRGNTWHALANTTTLFNGNDFWTSASLVMELTYQKLDKVTQNSAFFKSTNTTPAACALNPIVQGCSSDSAWHLALLFSPTWLQVFPQTDLTGTVLIQRGLKGNAATTGINEGATVFNLGLQIDYAVVNRFNISYTNFDGKRKYLGNTSAAGPYQAANGAPANYSDRDYVSFTYSRTF